MLLKVVIAEDDDFFRTKLIDKVASIKDVEIAYSTDNGEKLMNISKKIKPEIIITDIDMPHMTGIDAIKSIREELPHTEIIFITSYSKYIKEAYNLYALDFIEKPIDDNRLIDTIERIKSRFISKDKVFCFKTEDSMECVRANDLYFVEAIKRKTKIHTSSGIFLSNHCMKEISDILVEDIFYKSGRSYIVNLTKINKVKVYSRTSYELNFYNKEESAYLSKVNYEEFLEKVKKIGK